MKIKRFKLPHSKVIEGTNVWAIAYYTNHLRSVFNMIGTNMVDPGFTITPQLIVLVIATHSIILSFVYMLFTDASINVKLEALCVAAGVCQGIHKLYIATLYADECTLVFEKIRQIHCSFSNHPELSSALKQICVDCTKIVELLTVCVVAVIISYLLLPIILWERYGIFTTIFPIQYPFIDWHTAFGYAINTVNHAYCVTIGLTAILASDASFVFFILHTLGYRKIFESRISELDKILLKPGPQNKVEVQDQLHECVRAHQDYINYILRIDSIYSNLCLSQLFSSEVMLTVSLILTLWAKWIVGPFVIIIGLFQLLEYCILGTVVTYQNDKIGDIIYGFKWYLMPVRQQKLVILMILRAQNSPELTVGGFAELNVATCMSLLKTTYSLVMMVLKFLS